MNSQPLTWQQQLKQSFTDPKALLTFLNIHHADAISNTAQQLFSMRVPLSYAKSMEKGNLNDPLLQQVLPTNQEHDNPAHYLSDPVGDLDALKQESIIHKYKNRILLILTGGCAINCRFCFRRNFPYTDVQLNREKQHIALQYLSDNPQIDEVILSGGDPLLLHDTALKELLNAFQAIPHLKRIRIHSRIPIVLPARITNSLIEVLTHPHIPIIMVTHCNHPHELSNEVEKACLALKQANITLLNQSVLLKNINDDIQVLKKLSERLFNLGILPYYLHLLDHAKGTAHFEVDINQAKQLHQQLQTQISGYLVPKLVQEQAGKMAKTLII